MKEKEELSKHMGKVGSYAVKTDKFDPTLLDRITRESSRETWGITGDEFIGYDVWHCHEATFLLNNGVPIAGTYKLIYPSDSKYITESKGQKLYSNSFDMCRMGDTVEEAILNYQTQIKKDLEELLECKVQVQFFKQNTTPGTNDFKNYQTIESLIDIEGLQITDYTGQENHLKVIQEEGIFGYELTTNIVQSRCKITSQKDSSSIFIYLTTENTRLDIESLFEEITSLRMVDEFHEPSCEKLFFDFKKLEGVKDLCISMTYSRRGSLDINPVRSTSLDIMPQSLTFIGDLTYKQQGQ